MPSGCQVRPAALRQMWLSESDGISASSAVRKIGTWYEVNSPSSRAMPLERRRVDGTRLIWDLASAFPASVLRRNPGTMPVRLITGPARRSTRL